MSSYNSPFTGQVIQPTDVSYRAFTMTADTTLSWPLNGNATANYAARIMEVTASSSGLSLYMPPASQTSVGTDALILNVGSNSFTVKNYDGGTIVSIAAGQAEYIYVTTNANTAGTWGIIAFGSGTSTSSASALAGSGLVAQSTTLNQSHPTSGFATGYTFTSADRALTKLWSGGAGTATLPSAVATGDNWFILLKNNGTGSLTVSCSGSNTIDGSASKTFNPNESAFIICTGAAFISVGYGTNSSFAFTVLTKSITSGAYTLTANEAANTIQEYVGTLTGNVTVTYPPVVNLYVVSNQTSGSYTLTLTAGGTTATVPTGAQATLFCDGTNFYNANTVQAGSTAISLISGSAASPALNFSAESSTGIFRPGTGQFGISILGTSYFVFSATGLAVTGTGNFTNGISGGTF